MRTPSRPSLLSETNPADQLTSERGRQRGQQGGRPPRTTAHLHAVAGAEAAHELLQQAVARSGHRRLPPRAACRPRGASALQPSWWRHGGEHGVEGQGLVQRELRHRLQLGGAPHRLGHTVERVVGPQEPLVSPAHTLGVFLLADYLLATLGCACIDVYVLPCVAGKGYLLSLDAVILALHRHVRNWVHGLRHSLSVVGYNMHLDPAAMHNIDISELRICLSAHLARPWNNLALNPRVCP